MVKIRKYKKEKSSFSDLNFDQKSSFDYSVDCSLRMSDNGSEYVYFYNVTVFNYNFKFSFCSENYKKRILEDFVKNIKDRRSGFKCRIGNYLFYILNDKKIVITKNENWIIMIKKEYILDTFEKILQDERLI